MQTSEPRQDGATRPAAAATHNFQRQSPSHAAGDEHSADGPDALSRVGVQHSRSSTLPLIHAAKLGEHVFAFAEAQVAQGAEGFGVVVYRAGAHSFAVGDAVRVLSSSPRWLARWCAVHRVIRFSRVFSPSERGCRWCTSTKWRSCARGHDTSGGRGQDGAAQRGWDSSSDTAHVGRDRARSSCGVVCCCRAIFIGGGRRLQRDACAVRGHGHDPPTATSSPQATWAPRAHARTLDTRCDS
jgi:hypothetical protein